MNRRRCKGPCATASIGVVVACCIARGHRAKRASADFSTPEGSAGGGATLSSGSGGAAQASTGAGGTDRETSSLTSLGGAVGAGGGTASTADSGAGGGAGTGSGEACHGSPLVPEGDNLCFDSSVAAPLEDAGTAACAFGFEGELPLDFDFDRLALIHSSDGEWFEIPRLQSAEGCESDRPGWYLGFDEAGELATHANVCACSCGAIDEADRVYIFVWCD